MKRKTETTQSVGIKDVQRKWHLVDVKGKILGRITPYIAKLLQGKHKSNYVPYLDSGDYVVVINASHVEVTGNKADMKSYSYYSGYPGGLKQIPYRRMMDKKPQEIIRHAVSGMLPKNKLRDRRLTRLYIYPKSENPYSDKFQS